MIGFFNDLKRLPDGNGREGKLGARFSLWYSYGWSTSFVYEKIFVVYVKLHAIACDRVMVM